MKEPIATYFIKLFDYLRNLLQRTFPGDVEQLIADTAHIKDLPAGRILAARGIVSVNCWFLIEGIAMEFSYDSYREKAPLRFFLPESPIIPAGFIERQTSGTYIEMITDGILLTVTYDELHELFKKRSEVSHLFRLVQSDHENRGKERENLLTLSSIDRVRYLIDNRKELLHFVPGKQLAQYLNMSSYTYSHLKNVLGKKK